ncbi:MAG: RNA methyltransferase [Bacteroidales bacterium]|nr:RNA methyltransferase [Bacteroidales bacterium]MDE7073164.1 RNA methyltransferase [Bacteroidales bacterium]
MTEHKLKTMQELGRMSVDRFKESEKFPFCVVLDNVRSMHNIGACFRTCDAFRLEKLFLCGITAVPPHREIEKAALGATLSVDWEYCQDTCLVVERLKAEGYEVYAVEQVHGSIPLQTFKPEAGRKTAFVFGNEVEGVRQEVVDACHGAVEIPQFGTKHSFNISVTAGIVLWQAFGAYLQP